MKGSITVEHVRKVFRTPVFKPGLRGMVSGLFHREYRETVAVRDLSFQVSPGELVGYIGPNGAGKTTTVKLLTGILQPDSGSVRVNGFSPDTEKVDHARKISVMFGNQSRLYWNLPVQESLALLKEIYDLPRDRFMARRNELVEMLEIGSLLAVQARTLSLGQRIRCELAAALLHAPPMVFLDEPTIGLDVSIQARVRRFILEMNRRDGVTVILTSHDVQDIEELARRIMVIDHGTLVFDGSKETFIDSYSTGTRTVDLEFSMEINRASLSECLLSHSTVIESCNGYHATVAVSAESHVMAVLQDIHSSLAVTDVRIRRDPISQVIQRIYENHENVASD